MIFREKLKTILWVKKLIVTSNHLIHSLILLYMFKFSWLSSLSSESHVRGGEIVITERCTSVQALQVLGNLQVQVIVIWLMILYADLTAIAATTHNLHWIVGFPKDYNLLRILISSTRDQTAPILLLLLSSL